MSQFASPAEVSTDGCRWGPHGIRVNSLSPGYMKTDLILGLLEKEGSELVNSWIKDIPMGRMAHPSELQGTIVWMASDASSYLNGSDVVCPATLERHADADLYRLLMEDTHATRLSSCWYRYRIHAMTKDS